MEDANLLLATNYKSVLNTSLQYRIITAPASTVYDTMSNPDIIFKQIPLVGWVENLTIVARPVIKVKTTKTEVSEDLQIAFADSLKTMVDRCEVLVNGLAINNQSNLQNYFSIKSQLCHDDDSALAFTAPPIFLDSETTDSDDVIEQIRQE